MSEILLPPDSRFSQFFTGTFVGDDLLTANERAIILKANLKRNRDFSTGRYCAKKALEKFDIYEAEILTGSSKEPVWPAGFVGSISHSQKLVGAVVARDSVLTAIGLDIETLGGVKTEMWDFVFTNNEQNFLNTIVSREQGLYTTLLFSIKESFYKLQYPLTKVFLDFKDVNITHHEGTFSLGVENIDYPSWITNDGLTIEWTVTGDQVISICYLTQQSNTARS